MSQTLQDERGFPLREPYKANRVMQTVIRRMLGHGGDPRAINYERTPTFLPAEVFIR